MPPTGYRTTVIPVEIYRALDELARSGVTKSVSRLLAEAAVEKLERDGLLDRERILDLRRALNSHRAYGRRRKGGGDTDGG